MTLLDLHRLSDREAALLHDARRLARTFARHARSDAPAPEAVAALRASGLTALTVPEVHGGRGASLYEFVLVQEQLGRADASLALIHAMNAHVLGSVGEAGGWPEGLYARVAHAATRGELVNALASEPELGSPSRGGLPRTRAERTPDGWRLTGRKTWSTGASVLDRFVVTAADGDTVRRFLVSADAPGVRIESTWTDALALRASGSDDVVLDEVLVPHEDLVTPGPALWPSNSAWFWSAVAATYLGVGAGALHALADHLRGRVPTALGHPLAELPDVRRRAGQIELDLALAQSLLYRVTLHWSHFPERRAALLPALAGAKSAATNAAVNATDLALRVAGAPALSATLPLERFFRDARAGLTHPPTDDTAHELIGRARLELEHDVPAD